MLYSSVARLYGRGPTLYRYDISILDPALMLMVLQYDLEGVLVKRNCSLFTVLASSLRTTSVA